MSQEELSEQEIEAMMAAQLEAEAEAPAAIEEPSFMAGAQPAAKAQAGVVTAAPADLPLTSLYDLALPISIELGRTSMTVQEVLQLGRGSVIELDRLAGEPVDIYVGDRRFAEGEVVVLGENFGVRITRILQSSSSAEAA